MGLVGKSCAYASGRAARTSIARITSARTIA
jgi:hypothetical protein